MTVFVDASALVAMIGMESGFTDLGERLDAEQERKTSAIAIWESSLALARIQGISMAEAERDIRAFIIARSIAIVSVDSDHATFALAAYHRFGKGRHPARLNMGDCFAYACAKANSAHLLYEGNDFARTDLA